MLNNKDILEFEDMHQALHHYADKILKKNVIESANPKNKETYKKGIIELHPIFFELKDPKKVIFNLKNYSCLPYWYVSEILTEMMGMNPPLMNKYRDDIISWSYDLLDSGRSCYQYGVRWLNHNSIEKTLERLKSNPTSKRCYVPIFDQNDVGDSRDAPCNLGFLLLIRNNKLDLTLFTRSIDILRGFRYDFSLFSFIQQCFASWLDVELGSLFYYCNSLHCYSDKIEELETVREELDNNPREIRELNVDKNMEIGKTFSDLGKVVEIENLLRNGVDFDFESEKDKLNYDFAKRFIKIYKRKNER